MSAWHVYFFEFLCKAVSHSHACAFTQQGEDRCSSVGKGEITAIPEDDVFEFPSLEHIIDVSGAT